VDIPYIAYCDAVGAAPEPQRQYREGVYWIDFQRDIRAFLLYRKKGLLTFRRWLKSLFVEKEWAIYSRNDRKPALLAIRELCKRPWNVILRKLRFSD
jgi:predicted ATP-grasp superfamily ATP-dependent carboligase